MSKFYDRCFYLIPAGIGALLFYVVCGPSILDPQKDNWLLTGGDLTQQYFGWAFFRNSPWSIPLGLNPMYGMDISSSIVYSDGNPLLSLIFKPFNTLLPPIFQFQGIWLLICFLMQSVFAWRILGLYTKDRTTQILGSTLFLFSTPLLFRVGIHANLAAHFLILWGLYLNLRPWKRTQAQSWLALLVISLGVHFYLFAMICALWISDLADRTFIQKKSDTKTSLKSLSLTLLFIAFFAWQFGYLEVKSPSLFGYGFFKANVLSIFNPNGWSYFIKDIPIKSSWGEGNLYLGLGICILIILGVLKTKEWPTYFKSRSKNHIFLLSALFLLTLFSITNQIGIGPLEIRIPLTEWLIKIFGILRHSARLYWPVYYFILTAGCILVLNSFKTNNARMIFALCLIVQMIDLAPGVFRLHKELNAPITNDLSSSPLRQSFWIIASQRYKNIYLLPSRSEPNPDFMSRFMSSDWKVFGRYASLNQLNTNAVYMSRYDTVKQDAAYDRGLKLVQTGQYDRDTLYIIKNEDLVPVVLGLKDQRTFLAKIDGFNVLAPHFLESADLNLIGDYSKIDLSSIRPKQNQEISFKRPGSPLSSYALTKDWNNREDWGAWSKGQDAVLTLPLPATPTKSVTLKFRAFVNGAIPQQILQISSEGEILGNYSLSKFENNTVTLNIPNEASKKGYLSLNLKIPNAASPSSIGMDNDSRVLGVGIISATFN